MKNSKSRRFRVLLITGVSALSLEIALKQTRAADMPLVKAPVPVASGEFKAWVEGGAIWTGGDPITIFYPVPGFMGFGATSLPGFLSFSPRVGWEAATGFDY